jgi:thiol-disulfide isomerase/thioredoxin
MLLFGGCLLFSAFMFDSFDFGLDPPEIPSQEQVDLKWEVVALNGDTVNLEEAAQSKVIFLNFWSTSCPPCVKEMPNIEELYLSFKDRMYFACISEDDVETLEKFKAKKGLLLPLYHFDGERPSEFEAQGIPATFLISADRKILIKHIGAADWAHEDVVHYLEGIIEERFKNQL